MDCESRLVAWRRGGARTPKALLGLPANRGYALTVELLDRYVRFGGMPAIHEEALDDEERVEWLRDYQRTYLERDVGVGGVRHTPRRRKMRTTTADARRRGVARRPPVRRPTGRPTRIR